MVGEHGLTATEIREGEAAASAALASFRTRLQPEKPVAEQTYGFPHLPFDRASRDAITAYAGSVRGRFDTVCVVGIGGSALGAWALDCALRGPHPVQAAFSPANPRLVILDNVDPMFISDALRSMDPARTLVLAIAKSGATAETVAAFFAVRGWLEDALGPAAAKDRIAAVTSPEKGALRELVAKESYQSFEVPENVGGRFSVLCPVGLLPAALCGLDIERISAGAAEMTARCWKPDLSENPALRAAMFHWLMLTRRGKSIQVAFPYANRLWGVAFWFRQLWAESLGKRVNRAGVVVHTGQTPVATLGTTDQHSQVQLYAEGPNDKVFSFWAVREFSSPGLIPAIKTGLEPMDYLGGQTLAKLLDAEQRSTAAALTTAHRPNCTYTLDRLDEEHIGAFLQLFEFQTAFAGEMLGIDAFDQPGVEEGKKLTFALMGREGFGKHAQSYRDYEARREAARSSIMGT